MAKHYLQKSTLTALMNPYEKITSLYYGPRLKWMKLVKDDTTTRKKRQWA